MTRKKFIAFCVLLFISFQLYAQEIMVGAAASLVDSFRQIAKVYEKKYPEDKINFSFAASGSILQQMKNGAPIEIFASADEKTMDEAVRMKLIVEQSRVNFIHNKLVAVSYVKNNINANKLVDLQAKQIKKISIGNPLFVPAGNYAKEALEKQNLWEVLKNKFIYTSNVRQSLQYITMNEVDLGFVYLSDIKNKEHELKVLFEVPVSTKIAYPIGITVHNKAKNSQRFINFIRSKEGQEILLRNGFTK